MADQELTTGEWRRLFDTHPAVMLLVDPEDGRITSANTAAERFYGYSTEVLAAMRVTDLSADDHDEVLADARSAAQGERTTFSVRHRLADGEVRDVEVATAAVEMEGRPLLGSVVHDVTERRRTLAALAASEEFARSIVTGAPLGIVVADLEGRLIRTNQAMTAITGHPEHELLGRDRTSLVHPDDRDRTLRSQAQLQTGEVDRYELRQRYVRADGSIAHVSAHHSYLRDGDGQVRFQLSVVEDVTQQELERERAEQLRDELADSHRRFEALVEHASDPIVVLSTDGEVSYASPAAAAFLGAAALTPSEIRERISERDRPLLRAAWRALLDDPARTQQLVLRMRRADGRRRHLALTLSDLREFDAVAGVVVTARDLTDELAVRSRLEHQTTHDGLTGLANRDLLLDDLRAFSGGHVARPRPGVLILLDLTGMSGINDRIGHRTGDYLLRSVAHRLVETAGEHATVSRTSGDEFGLLIPGPDDEVAALTTAQRYAELFNEPFVTPGGGSVLLRARFGVALAGQHSSSAASVLRDANLALSAAQASAATTIRVCDDDLRREEERRLTLEYELATPSITDQLRLHYQPIVELGQGRITCVEALLRWDHAELGSIGPAEFVPLAERNGAIVPIGAWVLQEACHQLASWDAAGQCRGLELAINLSARQLLDVELVPALARVLAETGLAPDRISLEITETAIADQSAVTTATVQAIADLGVRIHIDDFGAGYSSFAQLGRFPFHGLKIDRSFIEPLGREPEAEPIVAALLAIAAAQGLEVIAEGVETVTQLQHLRRLGCPRGQGFLWDPALTAADVPDAVAHGLPHPDTTTVVHRSA